MPIFNSEAVMQAWLSRELEQAEGLADLITNLEMLEGLTHTFIHKSAEPLT